MKKLSTCTCIVCCLVFLAVIIAPQNADAQSPGQGGGPSSAGGRGYNENPGMGYFKGRSWQEVMDEFQNTPIVEAVFTTITRRRTYALTTLDNDLTSRAIALEQVKGSLVVGVVDEITAGGKAAIGGSVSTKIYGKSAGISYELLPGREDIKSILASLILVEVTDEDRGGGAVTLKAKTRVALSRIVPMISAMNVESLLRREIRGVRSMAADAMHEIVQLQETAAAGKGSALNQRYNDAVNRLITADQLERGRYFALQGQTEEAVDAYTKAIETSPGLSTAYRNRGGIHLYLKDHAKAMADFLNAYTSDAIDHTESREFQACIDDTEGALKLSEDYATAYYQRAVCRVGLRQQDGAMADFKMAAQLGEKRAQGILTSKGIVW